MTLNVMPIVCGAAHATVACGAARMTGRAGHYHFPEETGVSREESASASGSLYEWRVTRPKLPGTGLNGSDLRPSA
jgi:hypothetical protein